MVTPAAITMQIKSLEKNLGFNLMYREGRNINLTEEGNSIFIKAESIFNEISMLEKYLEEISIDKSEELRIGCHEVPARYIMPRLIDRFSKLYPNIKVILELGKTPVMLQKMLKYEIPLALVVKKQSDSTFVVKPILKDEIILVAAKNSSKISEKEISISKLQSIPLIVMEKESGVEKQISRHLSNFGITPNIVMETGSIDMLKEFVLKDKGLAFIEKFAIRDQLKNKLFQKIKIKEGSPYIDLSICYLKERKLSPVTQAFLSILDDKDL